MRDWRQTDDADWRFLVVFQLISWTPAVVAAALPELITAFERPFKSVVQRESAVHRTDTMRACRVPSDS